MFPNKITMKQPPHHPDGLPAPLRPDVCYAEKPNIVLIVADDLGYNDVGCYGASLVKTPRIDALPPREYALQTPIPFARFASFAILHPQWNLLFSLEVQRQVSADVP